MGMKMSQRKFHGFGTDLPARERENYAPRVARSDSAQRSAFLALPSGLPMLVRLGRP